MKCLTAHAGNCAEVKIYIYTNTARAPRSRKHARAGKRGSEMKHLKLHACLCACAMLLGSAAVPLTAGFAVSAAAADEGSCGENAAWSFDGSGTLTISGTGEISDWSSPSAVPWANLRSEITAVVIEDGITKIGAGTFSTSDALTAVTLPESLITIGSGAFARCGAISEITIPASVESIGTAAFLSCGSLSTVTILNDGCLILGDGTTICSVYDAAQNSAVFSGTICGYSGSTAEEYASKYQYRFSTVQSVVGKAALSFGALEKDDAGNEYLPVLLDSTAKAIHSFRIRIGSDGNALVFDRFREGALCSGSGTFTVINTDEGTVQWRADEDKPITESGVLFYLSVKAPAAQNYTLQFLTAEICGVENDFFETTLIAASLPVTALIPVEYAAGDLDMSQSITVADAVLLAHVLAEAEDTAEVPAFRENRRDLADLDNDGVLTLHDLRALRLLCQTSE